jgi:uncharacterized protein (TIGR02145 family)
MKKGNVSEKDYICQDKAWRGATAIESDLKLLCLTSNEGMFKKSNINENYYICESKAWRVSTEYEADTYKWICSTVGDIKDGQASGKKYLCNKNKAWEVASTSVIKCLEDNSCTFFMDARDSQYYRSVKIGAQTWMAENLNYDATGSKCGGSGNNCASRIYDWAMAMDIDNEYNGKLWGGSNVKHQGVCPSGWHLPSKTEWETLFDYTGAREVTSCLVTTTGWSDCRKYIGQEGNVSIYDDYYYCKDTYGFSALNGFSKWLSSSEIGDFAYGPSIVSSGAAIDWSGGYKKDMYSVRCVKD